jgi:AcrR family transcriptional regulator
MAGRQDRRRERTRTKLVDATHAVMAAKGVEATTIADITEAADVGFGTFYNYFESKDEALSAVVADVVEHLGAALDHLTAPMDDPAEVLAVSVRHTVAMAETDPVWAWFIVRVGLAGEHMGRALGPRLARDVRTGIDSGRFTVADPATATFAIGGAVQAVMRARLEGAAPEAAATAVAIHVLQMVGVPSRQARRIAAKPLPRLDQPEEETA